MWAVIDIGYNEGAHPRVIAVENDYFRAFDKSDEHALSCPDVCEGAYIDENEEQRYIMVVEVETDPEEECESGGFFEQAIDQ